MKKSIFENISFKQFAVFCLFFIIMDFWRFFNFLNKQKMHDMPFLSISVGLLSIGVAMLPRGRIEEKVAFFALGLSMIIDWLSQINLISVPIAVALSIVSIIIALVFFRSSQNKGR